MSGDRPPEDPRKARQAAALRDNLHRRKAQARARGGEGEAASAPTPTPTGDDAGDGRAA